MLNNPVLKYALSRRVQIVASILLFIAVFMFASHHSSKGIDLTDEGMYLSTAMRYTLGDTPFKDEMMNIMRPFDVLSSLIFRACPDITLLQMRNLGLALHGISYLLFFLFMSRYAAPLIVASLCCTMFLTNNFLGLPSPSYNSLSSDFSLISLTLWLVALVSTRMASRYLLAFAGGLALGIVVISYPPLITLTLIPVLVIGACYLNRKYCKYLLPSVVLITTLFILFGTLLVTIYQYGLWPSFMDNLVMSSKITDLSHKGLLSKIFGVFREYRYIAIPGMLLIIFLFSSFFIVGEKVYNRTIRVFLTSVVVIFIPSLFLYDRFIAISYHQYFPYIILSSTLPLVILAVFAHNDHFSDTRPDDTWGFVLYASLAWGFVSLFTYASMSSNGLKAGIQGLTPLFLASLITLYRTNAIRFVINKKVQVLQKVSLHLVVALVTLSFFIGAVKYYSRTVYLGQDVQSLTEPFRHPKLKGIYSTPDSVKRIEDLLDYLGKRVKRGDYLLAYNHLPLLYFLTDTRPACGAAWALDEWPTPLRKRLVKKMIDRDRIPEYCVRMLALPYVNYSNNGLAYDEDSPLDNYVTSHYYLEKIIYPFEIWHRGTGPKYRLYEQRKAEWKHPVLDWHCQEGGNERGRALPSFLSIYEKNGEFNFQCISQGNETIIRVTPAKTNTGGGPTGSIRFGSTLNKNELLHKFRPGSELALIVAARVSSVNELPNLPGVATALLFIKDSDSRSRMNAAGVYTTRWDEYIVTKRINEHAADDIQFGIDWVPGNERDWIDIKNPRFFIIQGNEQF